MKFHEIEMVGKFWVQEVTSLPTWTPADEKRVLYYNDTCYVGGSTGWEQITTGGNDAYLSRLVDDTHNGDITPSGDNVLDLGASGLRYARVYAVSFEGVTTTATYADLAEKYTMDKEYSVGTLMTITPNEEFEMSQCTKEWEVVTGVISDSPGFLLNADSVGQPLALVGKTPVRVTGPIEKGDNLSSNGDGTAVRTSGSMMAIALETNTDESEKLIMCLLKL